jgi:UDP-glucose 4-epimerase
MHHFVTGVAGFIGSQLADSLLEAGEIVSGADDFSLGSPNHLERARRSSRFLFFERDLSGLEQTSECVKSASLWKSTPDIIWHLAANSDIPAGVEDASLDFKRTLQTTFAVIEAARVAGVKKIAFASTSAVYGEHDQVLSEDLGPLLPISNYGATKLASEALLSAAAESILDNIWIFRFPNVVGPRATHGAIYDFIGRLAEKPNSLMVLGDGSQTKPYLHVTELIDAMKYIVDHSHARRNVFNIGADGGGTNVAFIAQQVIARVRPGTPISYTGGPRGWVGDVPRFRYCTKRLARLGWKPRLSSDQAVIRAINEIATTAAL